MAGNGYLSVYETLLNRMENHLLTPGMQLPSEMELAQELGLSAATMSHHMSALLTCGLVRLTKREGRVYYSLERQAVRRMLTTLEQHFLQEQFD